MFIGQGMCPLSYHCIAQMYAPAANVRPRKLSVNSSLLRSHRALFWDFQFSDSVPQHHSRRRELQFVAPATVPRRGRRHLELFCGAQCNGCLRF